MGTAATATEYRSDHDKMRDPERKAVCDILANGSTTALEGANDEAHRKDAAGGLSGGADCSAAT